VWNLKSKYRLLCFFKKIYRKPICIIWKSNYDQFEIHRVYISKQKIEVEIQKEKQSQNNPKKILILHKKIKQFKWKKGWPNLK